MTFYTWSRILHLWTIQKKIIFLPTTPNNPINPSSDNIPNNPTNPSSDNIPNNPINPSSDNNPVDCLNHDFWDAWDWSDWEDGILLNVEDVSTSINSKEKNIPSHNSQQSHKSKFRQNARQLSEPWFLGCMWLIRSRWWYFRHGQEYYIFEQFKRK